MCGGGGGGYREKAQVQQAAWEGWGISVGPPSGVDLNQGLNQDLSSPFLDRQFPENILFGQISVKNYQFCFFGGNNQIFS